MEKVLAFGCGLGRLGLRVYVSWGGMVSEAPGLGERGLSRKGKPHLAAPPAAWSTAGHPFLPTLAGGL